ncbi:hypothetical protein [Hungatella hathewayi]|uniref:hypothetical protein n=1 Tax=Hungatella hathewayi TaxID=154046 RepID=UPI0035648267
MDKVKYNVEFSKEELIMIYNVFCQLESKCFAKWRSLWPDEGEKISKECNEQWLLLGKIDEIKDRVANPLGLSVRKK